ncbi:MAG: methyltransferase regulatory domain-containing protein [Alphaproteobacteria bacterium]
MKQHIDLGPIELSYAAALRGIVPRAAGVPFRYIRCGAMDVQEMLGLAASNPDGEFVFVLPDSMQANAAQARARALRLSNLAFLGMSLAALRSAVADGTQKLATADYVCIDCTHDRPGSTHQDAMALADVLTAPGGLFACRYAPFATPEDSLRFMVTEFLPELPPEQHVEFLHELKQIGQTYFSTHPQQALALNQALGMQQPEQFLKGFGTSNPGSNTLSMIVGMNQHHFGFVGDAVFAANYLEMMVPAAAQEIVYGLREHLLYEIIKDFASARAFRTDIWVKPSAVLSGNLAQLFGGFYYGMTDVGVALPEKLSVAEQEVDLKTPLVARLLKLMQVMPITIGDFLAHEVGQEFKPTETVMAIQILVACGVIAPMRGSFSGMGQADHHYPRLLGQYNQQLRGMVIDGACALLASPVAGRPLRLDLPEALVLQAVDRVGFAESADSLMSELVRVSGNPAQARLIFTVGKNPAPEFAENLIREVCMANMVGWYALGILDVA